MNNCEEVASSNATVNKIVNMNTEEIAVAAATILTKSPTEIHQSASFADDDGSIRTTASILEYQDYCDELFKNHEKLCKKTEEILTKLLKKDKFLNDLQSDVTVEEVRDQIAVAKGQSITIYVRRGDLAKFKIVIPSKNTTVLKLKKAIQRNYEVIQRRMVDRENRRIEKKLKKHHKLQHKKTTIKHKKNKDNNRDYGQGVEDNDNDDDYHHHHQHQQHHKHHYHHHRQHHNQPHNEKQQQNENNNDIADYFTGKISWRYIWRTYSLNFDGTSLTKDDQLLSDYGISNKCSLKFVKKKYSHKK